MKRFLLLACMLAATAYAQPRQSTVPSAGYGFKVIEAVRSNLVYEPPVLAADVQIQATTQGVIVARSLIKSSGDAGYDKAVLAALEATKTVPTDLDGRVPSVMVLRIKSK